MSRLLLSLTALFLTVVPLPAQSGVMSSDQAILFWQERAKRDPLDTYSRAMLAHAHLRKAREAGDFSHYEKAEVVLREALKKQPNDLSARAGMVLVHCAQHRFREGLELAQTLCKENPEQPSLLLLVGDAQLELGDLVAAEKAYRDLEKADEALAMPDRLARIAELKGDTKEAIRLMEVAAERDRGMRLSKEGGAWYQARLAEMHFNAGRLAEAARHYEAARQEAPKSYVALAGLGRVRAAEGKYAEAIELYVKASGISPDPLVLTPLGDLYLKTGDAFRARVVHGQLEKSAQGKGAYDREMALFYADHDVKLQEALAAAERDLKVRQDVYAHDALAWARCKNERFAEAWQAMTEALRHGTRDASLHYHAGLIRRGLGDKDGARTHLKKALEINPHFSLLQAEKARAALQELGE